MGDLNYTLTSSEQRQCERLSKALMAPIAQYQKSKATEVGTSPGWGVTMVILGALAFVCGVLICRVTREDYRSLRDWFVAKMDSVYDEFHP